MLGYGSIELLLHQGGQVINHKTVLRLMSNLNLKILIRRKKYKSYKGEDMDFPFYVYLPL
jgi:putative transposase